MGVIAVAALAVVAGAPVWAAVVAVALSTVSTQLAFVGLVAAGGIGFTQKWRRRPNTAADESGLLRMLGGRVSAGATIRSAIADDSVVLVPPTARRLAALGEPMADVGDAMAVALPANAGSFKAICSFSEHTGAAVSAALDILAERADDVSELARQRKVTLAQVKLSAVVVGAVPMVVSLAIVLIRGVPDPGGAIVVIPMIAGLVLQTAGIAVVFAVASRSSA